jgi:hypothetical protein
VIELVEAIHSFDESKLGNVDVSIKIAGGPLDCCKTADSLTERFRCVESPKLRDSGRITGYPDNGHDFLL